MCLLFKNTLKKIRKSLGRYLSLFIIVMIGVGFFAGIHATAPDMVSVANNYYKEHNLTDFKIVSSMGLTDEDVNTVMALNNAKAVIPSYSLDVLDQDKAIRVHAIEQTVNKVKLVSGRLPQKENECIADNRAYKLGDKIRITSDISKKLKNSEFIVTGTAQSVLYLSEDYGNTTIGDGKLASFIFIGKSNFILDAYTEIYITAKETKAAAAYSQAYDKAAAKLREELVKIKAGRENARYQEIYAKANDEIGDNQTKLNAERAKGQKKLDDAKAGLDNNAQKLRDGKAELARNELDMENSVEKQSTRFKTAKAQIADGWKGINSALTQNGIKKEELNAKIMELDSATATMKVQLGQLPAESSEYARLSAALGQYSESYKGLLRLKASIDELTAREAELNKGIDTFNSEIAKATVKIQDGKSEITEKENKLSNGYKEYNENLEKFNTEISEAQSKIDQAKTDISDIEKPQWYIFDRDTAVGYSELKSGIDVITAVAAVLPFFFILIVVLMTSNSMARMIAEERSELGTLTSLGYKDDSIINTYLFYVLSATGLGAAAGFFTGCAIIPPLIYSNFQFILPSLVIQYYMPLFLLILAIALLLMTFVTIISCNRELNQEPAALLRPVPPQKGQTILLEKIGPVWKKLSFTWKVTMRNIFRYKKRAFMTIVGVAGCTSLMLAGFGLRDSMNGVAEKQFGEIFRYSSMIILNEEAGEIGGELKSLLEKEQIKEPLLIRQTAFRCEVDDKSQNLFLIVPGNEEVFYNYYNLKSRADGSKLTLKDSGVVITQNLSEVFGINKGGTISVKDSDNNEYKLTVSDVAENYASNYIYMNSAMYSKVFGKTASYNAIVSNHSGDERVLARHLIDSDLVMNVVYTGDVKQKALEGSERLNSIIILIVVVASLLAIIVLYNLTSINISERTREIATLKVLGFTDGETNGYIYREAFFLTLISIGVGLILGMYLHGFVVDVVREFAPLLFKAIKWPSFLLASLLTIVFTVIMQVITYFKLRTIDMIESLKSVE